MNAMFKFNLRLLNYYCIENLRSERWYKKESNLDLKSRDLIIGGSWRREKCNKPEKKQQDLKTD